MLTPAAQDRARTFIITQTRPLERTLYAYHFENGPAQAVYDALAAFQNPDGGFGHALEPDLRLPDSSALATTTALQILRELGAGSDHALVQGAMCYLLRIYDAAYQTWPIIPANVDDAPHAPWWVYRPDLTLHLSNPRPEIVGYCVQYADLIPADQRDLLLKTVLESVLAHFATLPDKMDRHDDLMCYVRLAETENLPAAIRDPLIAKLTTMIDASVSRDPDTWGGYVMRPLKVVHAPDSPFAAVLSDALATNLDYEIAQQEADGAWWPYWSWGDMHADVWPIAAQEWKGILTLNMLKTLRNFGRLA
ncbi:MAG: hypothetical protein JXA10_06820 [Anaerolineae bacterium]|nr:hypothetical protein [Anaerolineae bacterium]